MQFVEITLVKYYFTNITSLRMIQQIYSGLYLSTKYYKPQLYKELQFLLDPKRNTRLFNPHATNLNYNGKYKTKHEDSLKQLYSIVFSVLKLLSY
jgi:hypothetical protein